MGIETLGDDSRLYDAILEVLKQDPAKWWSSNEVIYHTDLKKYLDAYGNKRLSNYLGNLARRGTVQREGAAAHECFDGSRYVYSLGAEAMSSLLVNKPNMRIADDGKQIIIDLPGFIIRIDTK